mgnify:FL=1
MSPNITDKVTGNFFCVYGYFISRVSHGEEVVCDDSSNQKNTRLD